MPKTMLAPIGGGGATTAGAVALTPVGSISSTDVQGAFGELDTDLAVAQAALAALTTGINVKSATFGAKGDMQTVTGGAITSGSANLTVTTGVFTTAFLATGTKTVVVPNAGGSDGRPLVATVSARISDTSVTLSATAAVTVSGQTVRYGTNDDAAVALAKTAQLAAAYTDAGTPAGYRKVPYALYFPHGAYLVTSADALLHSPTTGTADGLRGWAVVGDGARRTHIIFASSQAATLDPRLGNLITAANRLRGARPSGFTAESLNPNQKFAWVWCTNSNNGDEFSAYGSGLNNDFQWTDITLDGTWKDGWTNGGDAAANQNSEQRFIRCRASSGASFGGDVDRPLGSIVNTGSAMFSVVYLNITGTPTGGTFTLTYGGQTTAGIAYNASAATIQTALQGLSSVGAGNMTVTASPSAGGASNPSSYNFIIKLTGTLAGASTLTASADGTGLTGGSSPAATVVRYPDQQDQAVNWTFDHCDFEYTYGHAVVFPRGGHILAIGGSWINGISMPTATTYSGATAYTVGQAVKYTDAAGVPRHYVARVANTGVAPDSDNTTWRPWGGTFFKCTSGVTHASTVKHLQVIGTRFEFRTLTSKRCDIDWSATTAHIRWENISEANTSITSGDRTSHQTARYTYGSSQPDVTHQSCEFSGYVLLDTTATVAVVSGGYRIGFKGCGAHENSAVIAVGTTAATTTYIRYPNGGFVPKVRIEDCAGSADTVT